MHFRRKNLPFLKVFPSVAIYPLLRLISWNLKFVWQSQMVVVFVSAID